MKKNYQSFESYLGDVCPDTGRGGADGAHEAYERWIENLDAAEVMDYAEQWGNKMYRQGQDDFIAYIRPDVDKIIGVLSPSSQENGEVNLGLNAEEEAQALDAIENVSTNDVSDELPH